MYRFKYPLDVKKSTILRCENMCCEFCVGINLGYKDCTYLCSYKSIIVNAFSDDNQTLTIELMENLLSIKAKRLVIRSWV